jgi:hypothetical protein
MMKLRVSVAAVIAIVSSMSLGLAGVADAATIFTSALFVTTGEQVSCNLVNTGTSNSTVTLKTYDRFGNEVDTLGPNVVAAGDVLANTFTVGTASYFYCKAISSSSNARVGISRFIGTGSDLTGFGTVK